jgi:hypothetical protein
MNAHEARNCINTNDYLYSKIQIAIQDTVAARKFKTTMFSIRKSSFSNEEIKRAIDILVNNDGFI